MAGHGPIYHIDIEEIEEHEENQWKMEEALNALKVKAEEHAAILRFGTSLPPRFREEAEEAFKDAAMAYAFAVMKYRKMSTEQIQREIKGI